MNKLLTVVGPTSSGKSELAVRLAKKFNGEIISCDSRQVYEGMNIGTGKVPGKWHVVKKHSRALYKYFIYKGVIHHLIDFVSPKRQYSVAMFKKQAEKVIYDIIKRGKLPILCGGTGHWVDAVVYDQHLPEVKPDKKLRAKLEKETTDELYQKLMKLDPARAKEIDRHNKRRLIRALEIVLTTNKPVPSLPTTHCLPPAYPTLQLGLTLPKEELYDKIERRLKQRFKQGLIKETAKLRKQGLSWKKLEAFGLSYKFAAQYLQRKIDKDEMLRLSLLSEKHYAKRQMTWFKRNKDIIWIENYSQAKSLVSTFLKR